MSEIDWLKETKRRKFRVKIKSLAEEARIIRCEEKKFPKSQDWQAQSSLGELRGHRVGIVRNEQRATLLAYAYWKGMPYRRVESTASKPIPVKRVKEILKSLAWMYDPEIESWVSEELVSK